MVNVDINFDLFYKLLLYVLLPTIVVIIISRMIVALCTRKIKETNPSKYYFVLNYWTSLVAMIITIVLIIITYMYSKYFIGTLQDKGLIEKAKPLYYVVRFSPAIPAAFFVYYLVGVFMIKKNYNKHENYSNNEEELLSDETSIDDTLNSDSNTVKNNETDEEIEVL